MITVRELHDRATELTQMAIVARHEGQIEKASHLIRQALEYEIRAAGRVPNKESSEPTRSILYLSAASLAYQCKDLQTAERFVAEGLSGYPPPEVEQDLRDLRSRISFEHHTWFSEEGLDNQPSSLRGRAATDQSVTVNDEVIIPKSTSLPQMIQPTHGTVTDEQLLALFKPFNYVHLPLLYQCVAKEV